MGRSFLGCTVPLNPALPQLPLGDEFAVAAAAAVVAALVAAVVTVGAAVALFFPLTVHLSELCWPTFGDPSE